MAMVRHAALDYGNDVGVKAHERLAKAYASPTPRLLPCHWYVYIGAMSVGCLLGCTYPHVVIRSH